MQRFVIVLFFALLIPHTLSAADYQEVVSSIDSDFYKIDSKSILIHTENCFETVESQQVVVTMEGMTGQMVFGETGTNCAVAGVYRSSGYRVGNYRVDITREEEDWYKISEQNIYILTEECLIYATEQEGLLSVSTVGKSGGGSLHFEGEACKVIGLYSPLNL